MQRGVDPDTIEVPGTGLERARVWWVFIRLSKISKSQNLETRHLTLIRKLGLLSYLVDLVDQYEVGSYETLIMNS
jgi:hypothetical protein